MSKLRINKVDYPFDLSVVERDSLLSLFNYYKQSGSFNKFLDVAEPNQLKLYYTFIGWFKIQIEKKDIPDFLQNIFKMKG